MNPVTTLGPSTEQVAQLVTFRAWGLQRSGRICAPDRYPAYAAYARLEKVPRKTPDKPVDNVHRRTRNSWSAKCACAREREKPPELVAGVTSPLRDFWLQI